MRLGRSLKFSVALYQIVVVVCCVCALLFQQVDSLPHSSGATATTRAASSVLSRLREQSPARIFTSDDELQPIYLLAESDRHLRHNGTSRGNGEAAVLPRVRVIVLFGSLEDVRLVETTIAELQRMQHAVTEFKETHGVYLDGVGDPQFAWSWCPVGAPLGDGSERRDTACELVRVLHLAAALHSAPQVVVLAPDGSRRLALERHGVSFFLRNSGEALPLLFALSRQSPYVRELFSMSDVASLPATIASHDVYAQPAAAVVIVAPQTGVSADVDSAAYVVAEHLRLHARVYVVRDEHLSSSLTACSDVEGESNPPSANSVVALVLRMRQKHDRVATFSSCTTPLFQAAEDSSVFVAQVVLSAASSVVPEETHVADTSAALRRVLRYLLDDVEVSFPGRRDLQFSRTPQCVVLMFVPNLLNVSYTTQLGIPHRCVTSAEGSGAVSFHSEYYVRRLRRVVSKTPIPCTALLFDPGQEKELFSFFGFKSSDIYQTSAEIRKRQSVGGRAAALGKTRDNLIVLSVNNSWRVRYDAPYFDEHILSAFVSRMIRSSANELNKVALMRSALPVVDPSSPAAAALGTLPWKIVYQSQDPHSADSQLRRVRNQLWMSTMSFDQFERYVPYDLSRDSVVLLVSSVTNVTRRQQHGESSIKLEATVGQVLVALQNAHPTAHAAIHFVRLALDTNDTPAALMPHIETLQGVASNFPQLYYLPRGAKYDWSKQEPRNFQTHPIGGTFRSSEAVASSGRSDALKAIAKPINIQAALAQSTLTESFSDLRAELRRASSQSWLFDVPSFQQQQPQQQQQQQEDTETVDESDEF